MKRTADSSFIDDSNCCRVFVGSLAFATTWHSLKDHFKGAGDIEFASVLKDPAGRSKGCGMVDYKTPMEAQQAVALLDGSNLDGRTITVKLDVDGKKRQSEQRMSGVPPVPQKGGGKSQSGQFYHVSAGEVRRVFVGNLSYDTNWQALKDYFTQVGPVELASVLLRPDRTSKGCGMVDFSTNEDAVRAAEMLNNTELDGRNISVKVDTEGWFRSKPAAGSRPPVFQVKPGEGGWRPPFKAARYNGPARAEMALQNLSAMASMPGARNFDWPTILRGMSR